MIKPPRGMNVTRHNQEDAGVLVTTALDVSSGFGMFLVINATNMQVKCACLIDRIWLRK
jgi:hypothetical protein